jgi:hypothetical protein
MKPKRRTVAMTGKEKAVIHTAKLFIRDFASLDLRDFEVLLRLRNLQRAVYELEKVNGKSKR